MTARYEVHRAATNVSRSVQAHDGQGMITVERHAFSTTQPRFVRMTIPPGGSEGMHVHHAGDPVEPPFDEFYLILAGAGTMLIGEDRVPVGVGDHVYVPRDVAHGIVNDTADDLAVLITFIDPGATDPAGGRGAAGVCRGIDPR